MSAATHGEYGFEYSMPGISPRGEAVSIVSAGAETLEALRERAATHLETAGNVYGILAEQPGRADKNIAEFVDDANHYALHAGTAEAQDEAVIADEVAMQAIEEGRNIAPLAVVLERQPVVPLQAALSETAIVKGATIAEQVMTVIENARAVREQVHVAPEGGAGAAIEEVDLQELNAFGTEETDLSPWQVAAESPTAYRAWLDELDKSQDKDEWLWNLRPIRELADALYRGEQRSDEDIAAFVKLGFSAARKRGEAWVVHDPPLGSIDKSMSSYLDFLVPDVLASMSVKRLNELMQSDAYGHSPVLKGAVERTVGTIEHDGEVESTGGSLYARLHGFETVADFAKYYRSIQDHPDAQVPLKLLNHPHACLGDVVRVTRDTSSEGFERRQAEREAVAGYLDHVLGLSSHLADQILWATRHEKRSDSSLMTLRRIATQIEYDTTTDEMARIFEKTGLVDLERYTPEQLRTMRQLVEGDPILIEHLKQGEVMVVITDSTEDWNGAFRDIGRQFKTEGGRTLFFEISSATNGLTELEKCNSLLGRYDIHPSTIVLGAHGTPEQSMGFGSTQLDASTIKEWSQDSQFDRLLQSMRDGEHGRKTLVLMSCSQGSYGPQGISMGAEIAGRTGAGVDVFAPPTPVNIDRVADGEIVYSDDGGRVDAVRFRAPEPGVIVRGRTKTMRVPK